MDGRRVLVLVVVVVRRYGDWRRGQGYFDSAKMPQISGLSIHVSIR